MAKFQTIVLLLFILTLGASSGDAQETQEDRSSKFHADLLTKVLEFLFKARPARPGKSRIKLTLESSHSNMKRIQVGADVVPSEIHTTAFNPERKTVFIIHGFQSNGTADWVQQMMTAYTALNNVNVIAVDWSAYATGKIAILARRDYFKAVANLGNAATEIITFMRRIMAAYPNAKTWGKIHLIGHSLGAHVSGLVAKKLKKLNTKWQIARITGLDPAHPTLFGSSLSLNKNDAPFVDIIHTNAKILGIMAPIGHIDFYVNGGRTQLGCRKKSKFSWIPFKNLIKDLEAIVCSHGRAYEYYLDTVQFEITKWKHKYWGHKYNHQVPTTAIPLIGQNCTSNICVEMGINAEKYQHQSGSFFVPISSEKPFTVLLKSDVQEITYQLYKDEEH